MDVRMRVQGCLQGIDLRRRQWVIRCPDLIDRHPLGELAYTMDRRSRLGAWRYSQELRAWPIASHQLAGQQNECF